MTDENELYKSSIVGTLPIEIQDKLRFYISILESVFDSLAKEDSEIASNALLMLLAMRIAAMPLEKVDKAMESIILSMWRTVKVIVEDRQKAEGVNDR